VAGNDRGYELIASSSISRRQARERVLPLLVGALRSRLGKRVRVWNVRRPPGRLPIVRPLRFPERVPMLVPVLLPLAALALSRLTPPAGIGVGYRVGAAATCVLLLPGFVMLTYLGWPSALGVAIAAAFAWSICLCSLALAIAFLFERSLSFAALGASLPLLLLGLPKRQRPPPQYRNEILPLFAVIAAGALFALAVASAIGALRGDALFHLGRAEKLNELDHLSLEAVGEFRGGDLHPGYAFPAWQGVIALIARLASVEVVEAGTRLAPVLVPFSLACFYAAGSALLRSRLGGVATALAATAIFDLSSPYVTSFRLLSFPAAASVLVLVPATLALVFAYVARGERRLLISLAAGGIALALAHASYLPFLCLILAGFLLASLVARRSLEWRRSAVVVGVLAGASAPFLVWLAMSAPAVTAATDPEALERYGRRLERVAGSLRLDPAMLIEQQGAWLGFLALPLVFLANPRARALVGGGCLAVLAFLLVPFLFEMLADLVSHSQALRLRYFLPLPFAVGAAAVALGGRGRRGLALAFCLGLLAGAAAGAGLPLLLGGAAAAVVAVAMSVASRRPGDLQLKRMMTLACVLALSMPSLAVGLLAVKRPEDPEALTRGLVQALKRQVSAGEVILARPVISNRILAEVPVYGVAVPLTHVAQTPGNRARQRLQDASRFFRRALPRAARERILNRYQVNWVVLDKFRQSPVPDIRELCQVYEDRRYVLLRVSLDAAASICERGDPTPQGIFRGVATAPTPARPPRARRGRKDPCPLAISGGGGGRALPLLARLELEPSGRHACEQSLSLLVRELSERDASGNFHFPPQRLRGPPVSPVG
jgi:hypothetical protein